ncbi:hypothetical protein K227x_47160 [Rubripirellula lacrimiformis]|uniref:Uncharacterized protein n=1 Tax=Rubripirellula lacrimiformis TaxID=1930273 RepID=A0A517NGQ0_9BACT|nr:hypothetical protein K227x_47160 [Rubripirellula lacrimiformis]
MQTKTSSAPCNFKFEMFILQFAISPFLVQRRIRPPNTTVTPSSAPRVLLNKVRHSLRIGMREVMAVGCFGAFVDLDDFDFTA